MHTYYLNVQVDAYDVKKEESILKVLRDCGWEFEEVNVVDRKEQDKKTRLIVAMGEDDLQGDTSPEDYLEELTHKIWEANEAYCHIEFFLTYLDEAPTDEFERNEEDYEMWKSGEVAE